MNYIKLYFMTHLKYWWIYLISIWTLIFGYAFAIFSILFLVNWGINDIVASILGLISASLIISAPIVFVNYKVASSYISNSNKKMNTLVLTLGNHLVTYLVYLTIFLTLF